VRIMDHLGKQENSPARILLERPVSDLDGILDAVAEAEMPGDFESHGTEIKDGRSEVLLARIHDLPRFLDGRDDRAPIELRDVELPRHEKTAGGLTVGGVGPLGRV